MGAASNIFGFSSAATSDLKDSKTLTAGGVGLLPGLLVGAGVLVGLLCMSAFFYALHTRRRSKLNLLYTAIGGALLLSVLSWRTGCSIERASIYFIIMIIILTIAIDGTSRRRSESASRQVDRGEVRRR